MTLTITLRTMVRSVAVVVALLAAPTIGLAHEPKGAHGGPQADAGALHVEVVANGTTLEVFLRDHGDRDVATAGYKGIAIFVVGGKPQRIPLTPAGTNKLAGASPVALPKEPKGAVQITVPGGSTVQAKFQ
jgi:hypothetical protein